MAETFAQLEKRYQSVLRKVIRLEQEIFELKAQAERLKNRIDQLENNERAKKAGYPGYD